MGILFTPLTIGLFYLVQNKANKSMKTASSETINEFYFSDEKFCIIADKGYDYKANVEMTYKMVYKAEELKDFFLIYPANSHFFVVPKKDFIEGTPEDLRMLLMYRLQVGFKRKTK